MQDNTSSPTPTEAREALQASERHTLDTSRDRRVHALATILFGVVVATYIFLSHTVLDRDNPGVVPAALYVLVLCLLAWWQSRTARTQPRGVKWTSTVGVAVCVVVGLIGSIILNMLENTHPGTTYWLLSTVVALAALIPAVVAAARIVNHHPAR